MNPVRARLSRDPHSWKWSSARAHLTGTDDQLVNVSPLLAMVGDWKRFVSCAAEDEKVINIRKHERTDRPLGGESFIATLEAALNRTLKRRKPGPRGGKDWHELSMVSPEFERKG